MLNHFLKISIGLILVFNNFLVAEVITHSKNSQNEDVINFELPDYTIKQIEIGGEICNLISVEGLSNLNIKGAPSLPFKTFSFALNCNGDYKIEIDMKLVIEKEINKILPAKGKIYRNIDPSTIKYVFNERAYSENNFYPENLVDIKDVYMLRDQRGATIQINPIQYNPVKGTVKIIKKLQFRIIPTDRNNRKAEIEEKSAVYKNLLSNLFINSEKTQRYTAIDENDEMIIITTSKYKDATEKLAFWKNRSGIKTDVYEYPTDFNGTGDQAVKSLIQEKYNTDKISYILIIGDFSDVPSPLYTQQEYDLTTAVDPTYTYLSGDDKKPDAFIGRFSVETEEQAMTVVNKNLNYECYPKTMGTENTEWFTSCMGIASAEGSPTDKVWLNGFKDTLFSYNYKTYDSAYDPSATSSMISNAINSGKGWVNYMGHGDFELWATGEFQISHVNSLNNTGKLPIIISVACVNGEFKDRTCFAEAWQRLGSPTESKGSVVFLGSSVYQDWTSPQTSNQEMMHLLKKDAYASIGAVINNGQLKMLEQDNNQETFETWHIFGDPSLRMITDVPTELNVTHEKNIDLGEQTVEISVSGADDAKICLYSKNQNIQIVRNKTRAFIPVNITTTDTIYVTVTARNKVPYQGFIIPGNTPINNIKLSASKVNVNIKKGKLNIKTYNNSLTKVAIYNISGKLIKEYSVSGFNVMHTIDLPNVSGMNIIRIKNNGINIYNKKFSFIK